MTKNGPSNLHQLTFAVFATASLLSVSCSELGERIPPNEHGANDRYSQGTITHVEEPYDTTNSNYTANELGRKSTEMSIADLKSLISKNNNFWFGYSPQDVQRKESIMDKCSGFNNPYVPLQALPATIRGVVTINPRYYKKIGACDTKSRVYGSFWIQDETGGIFVARNSKQAGFDAGDIVTLNVRGVGSIYQMSTITTFDNLKVVTPFKDGIIQRKPVYSQVINKYSELGKHLGEVVTVTGEVVSPPTNANFNSTCLVPVGGNKNPCQADLLSTKNCCNNTRVFVSIDKEIGQRAAKPIKKGDIITVSGPIDKGFNGNEISVLKIGQYSIKPK